MKKLLERKDRKVGERYPCGYEVGNIVPASRKVWEGSPWRAFLFLGREA